VGEFSIEKGIRAIRFYTLKIKHQKASCREAKRREKKGERRKGTHNIQKKKVIQEWLQDGLSSLEQEKKKKTNVEGGKEYFIGRIEGGPLLKESEERGCK